MTLPNQHILIRLNVPKEKYSSIINDLVDLLIQYPAASKWELNAWEAYRKQDPSMVGISRLINFIQVQAVKDSLEFALCGDASERSIMLIECKTPTLDQEIDQICRKYAKV